MRYQFNSSVSIDKKDFLRGIHEVPEKIENHPHFLKYVGLGIITDPDQSKITSTVTEEQRRKTLLDRVMAKGKKPSTPVAPSQVPEATPAASVLPAKAEEPAQTPAKVVEDDSDETEPEKADKNSGNVKPVKSSKHR